MENWNGISLYHYTSFQALEGILKSKELWLGNLKYMNDRKELQFFFDGIKKALIRELYGYENAINGLFEDQMKRFEGKTSYAFSLSKQVDDASQWDRYASKGRGVCIKFNAEKLKEVIKGKATLNTVFYNETLQDHSIKNIIVQYIMNNNLSGEFSSINEVFENAWACAAAFKHPSFKAESEVRICAYPFIDQFLTGELKYKVGEYGLREYYPISLGSGLDRTYGGTIEGIIIGPSAGIDTNILTRYLQMHNVDISNICIGESNCPLR